MMDDSIHLTYKAKLGQSKDVVSSGGGESTSLAAKAESSAPQRAEKQGRTRSDNLELRQSLAESLYVLILKLFLPQNKNLTVLSSAHLFQERKASSIRVCQRCANKGIGTSPRGNPRRRCLFKIQVSSRRKKEPRSNG